MGWTEYIIIPNWKVAIEINRSTNQIEQNEFENAQGAVTEYLYQEEEDKVISEKKPQELNLNDLSLMLRVCERTTWLEYTTPESLLMLFLDMKEISWERIYENQFRERKKEFENYKVMRIE